MFLVVFRNRKRADMDVAGYAADSEKLVALVRAQNGFVSHRRYIGEDGQSLSIAEFETEADACALGAPPGACRGAGKKGGLLRKLCALYLRRPANQNFRWSQ